MVVVVAACCVLAVATINIITKESSLRATDSVAQTNQTAKTLSFVNSSSVLRCVCVCVRVCV